MSKDWNWCSLSHLRYSEPRHPGADADAARLIGFTLALMRFESGRSKAELARDMGMRLSRVSAIEYGKSNLSIITIVKWASVCGIDPGTVARDLCDCVLAAMELPQ